MKVDMIKYNFVYRLKVEVMVKLCEWLYNHKYVELIVKMQSVNAWVVNMLLSCGHKPSN